MSYILEALKKAEAERQQQHVPGLSSQPMPAPAADTARGNRTAPLVSISAAAVALIAVGVAWLQPWHTPAQPAETRAPAPVVAAADTAPAAATKPQAAIAPPAAATQSPVAAAPAIPAPVPSARVKSPPRPRAPIAHPAPANIAAPARDESLPTLHQLPDGVQRELPQLNVAGYIYADKAADRSVVINNRLLHEGDRIAGDLVLERMLPTGMVLAYRGYRFRTSY